MTTAVPLPPFLCMLYSCPLVVLDPPGDPVVFHITRLCYSLKLPRQNPCPLFFPGDSYKKGSLLSDTIVWLFGPSDWKGTVFNNKSNLKTRSFFIIILFPGKCRRFQWRKLVRSTCAGLAALSWCYQGPCVGAQLPPSSLFSTFKTMSPAGAEGKSCFIGRIDSFKQQCFDED